MRSETSETTLLLQHLGELTRLVELLDVGAAADEVAIDEHSRNARGAVSHVAENCLNVLTVGTILQLDGEEIEVELLELLKNKNLLVVDHPNAILVLTSFAITQYGQ